MVTSSSISLEPFPCLPTATSPTQTKLSHLHASSQHLRLSPIVTRPVYSSSITGCLEFAPMHSSLSAVPLSCTRLSSVGLAAKLLPPCRTTPQHDMPASAQQLPAGVASHATLATAGHEPWPYKRPHNEGPGVGIFFGEKRRKRGNFLLVFVWQLVKKRRMGGQKLAKNQWGVQLKLATVLVSFLCV